MITSSSKRVLKRPDKSGAYTIEQYIPPTEVTLQNLDKAPRRAVFPRYDQGEEEFPALTGIPPQEEDIQSDQEDFPLDTPLEEEEPEKGDILFQQTEEEAARLLEEARRDAEEIRMLAEAEAREEASQAKEDGFKEGYEAGFLEGRKKAEEECREELRQTLLAFQEEMKRALSSVETAKEQCLHRYLDELKDCAVAVGEKVIHISLKSSGEVIEQMIVSATEKLKKTAWVKIYIDKFDYDMMMEADTGILDQLSHLSDNIKFIVMDKEDRGNCIIEMPEEIVDVSVNTQIENIKDILGNVGI